MKFYFILIFVLDGGYGGGYGQNNYGQQGNWNQPQGNWSSDYGNSGFGQGYGGGGGGGGPIRNNYSHRGNGPYGGNYFL